MRKYKELNVWKESVKLVTEVYKLCTLLPDSEKYGMISQMQRASVSIPSNIAEGCSRRSNIEFARFLEISLGSAFELETQLIIISKLKLLNINKSLEEVFLQIEKVQKMMNSFKTKILKPNNLKT